MSAVSTTVTVTSADRTAPLPVTGLTATPRADGTVLRWNAPVDDDIAYYDGWIGTRRDDGTVRWLDSCFDDGAGDPLAMLCVDIPDGETLVYAVTARDKWGNSLPVTDPSVPTVSSTELDTRAAESIHADNAPLLGGGGWTWTSDITEFDWRCEGDVCTDITAYRISRWDPVTRTYGLLDTVPAVPDTSRYTYLDETQPLGQVSYYRVVGVRTDGTETPAAHPYRIRPDVV